eukprot:Gregarina_sp_Poly_1__355@NODE_1086_length_5140_cov_448_935344_g288_i1_p7_GENE_NODE_1086_length_5140_cov_448_935344_g288_i1NODE_1086_length_5140_cov_448_935344_g288_i1_p7_ORF_typecomplete_len100_score5_72Adeno_E3B/PF03376_14/0_12_NODE_1086_length_5140_cov_448_935344_g288_i139564255
MWLTTRGPLCAMVWDIVSLMGEFFAIVTHLLVCSVICLRLFVPFFFKLDFARFLLEDGFRYKWSSCSRGFLLSDAHDAHDHFTARGLLNHDYLRGPRHA